MEDVVDFVKSGDFLIGAKDSTLLGDVLIVRDLARAHAFAWEELYGEEKLHWTDIRQKEMSDVKGISYSLDGFSDYRDNLTPLLQKFTVYIKRKLDSSHVELLDDIVGDLYNCAYNRCVQGTIESTFFERLLAVYRAGGWPCGWDGEYPHGRLAVYLPQNGWLAPTNVLD